MKVCIDISPAVRQVAGIGRYAYELAQRLEQIDKENDYRLFFNAKDESELPKAFKGSTYRTVRASDKPWRAWLQIAHRVNWSMDRRLDWIDLFHGTDCIYPPLRRSKVVVTIHDLSFLRFPQFHTRPNQLNLRLLVPLMVRKADMVIADSDSTRRDLVELLGTNERKIRVIHLGVDDTYTPISDEVELARIRNKYSLSDRFLLYTGTLEPRKNLRALIEAYGALRSRRQIDHQLVIAGKKGWLYEDIFARVQALGLEQEIIFTGYVPEQDLPVLYSAAGLFVYPSFYEGFGLPPLEAMACGTPVVCSNTSSLPEVVGDAAITVDPHDQDALAAAIGQVVGDRQLAASMRGKGLARAKLFTWSKTAEQTLEVYKAVVSQR